MKAERKVKKLLARYDANPTMDTAVKLIYWYHRWMDRKVIKTFAVAIVTEDTFGVTVGHIYDIVSIEINADGTPTDVNAAGFLGERLDHTERRT